MADPIGLIEIELFDDGSIRVRRAVVTEQKQFPETVGNGCVDHTVYFHHQPDGTPDFFLISIRHGDTRPVPMADARREQIAAAVTCALLDPEPDVPF